MLKPTYTTAPAAFKNDVHFKSGQNWLENKQLALSHSALYLLAKR